METNFKAQERIGADFVCGPSGTLGEFKAVLQVGRYLLGTFLQQCYCCLGCAMDWSALGKSG